ncbi:MAG: CBS domain-containing protein [Bacteroidales bacterium]|nr:CBS domain-containing protein [Bacteroidales bacterium]
MLALDLISKDFPVLLPSDDGNRAIDIMENYMVSDLAVIDKENVLGLISMSNIYDLNILDSDLITHQHKFMRAFVFYNQHLFDVINAFELYNTSIIPVVDKNLKFLGIITQKSILSGISNILSVKEQGYHLKFSLNYNDYSATEISNIIEKNDSKLLSLFIENKASTEITIFIKVFTNDIEAIIQSFERYKYDVILLNNDAQDYDELYNERMDNFLHFLNI